MKVLQRRLPNGNFMLEATATVKEVAKAFDQAQILFANKMGLQPEPGKTPAMVAEERLGIKDLDSVVDADALDYLWPFAVEQRNMMPAYPPTPMSVTPLRRGLEYKFQLEVAPKKRYELTSYDPITIEAPKLELDFSEVDRVLADLAERYTEYETDDSIKRPVEKNDPVLIKMDTVRENGEPFRNLTFDSRPYVAGQHFMPDAFDSNIIGLEIGQERTFDFDAPTLDGQGNPTLEKVKCTVKLLEFQRPKQPEIDDAWVKRYMPAYDSREALVNDIKKHETEEQTFNYTSQLQTVATQEIAKVFDGKIPDDAYIAMREGLRRTLRNNLRQQNMTYGEYVKEIGGEDQLNMMLLLEARQTLTQGYALDAVYRHFKLHYTDEDINAMCRTINPQNPMSIRQGMEQGGRAFALRESTERFVASRYLVEHATIVEPAKEEASE